MSETEQQAELQPVTNEPTVEESKPATNEPAAEAAEPAATNEPVEGGDAASAAEDALLTNVTPTIFAALSFIAFVLFVVGTPLPWLRNDIGNRIQVSLWAIDTELPGGGSSVVRVADFPCNKMKQYFRGAEAFSIITIFFAAVTVLVGVLARSRGTSAKPLGTVFAFLTFLSSLICWGIGVAAYRRDFCGQTTFDEARYRVYVGAGLFVGGWVVSAIAFAISLKDIKVPKALPEAAVNKLVATLFTIVSLAAFLFALISTPISVFSKWTSTSVESRVSIWHTYVYTNGVMTTKASLSKWSTCGDIDRYAKATQAFSIITIVTCLIAAGAGVAALRGIGGNKGLILTGLVATLTGVIASGLDLTIFYKQFCNSQSLDAQHYNRDAGLALMVTSFVIMAAVTLLAIFAAVLQLCSSKPEGGNASKGSFLYIFGTIVSIAFLVVAIATPVLSRETSATSWTQVQWWQVETRNGATYTTSDFTCQKTWQRLVGGASIIVAAIAISSFGAIIGVAQFSNGALQVPATAFGLLSAVLQLIAFALAIDAWRTTYCGVNLKKANFDYDIGFALVPAAFCITVIVSILNLVLKA